MQTPHEPGPSVKADDELGFDPFHETQKALAELMENEIQIQQQRLFQQQQQQQLKEREDNRVQLQCSLGPQHFSQVHVFFYCIYRICKYYKNKEKSMTLEYSKLRVDRNIFMVISLGRSLSTSAAASSTFTELTSAAAVPLFIVAITTRFYSTKYSPRNNSYG